MCRETSELGLGSLKDCLCIIERLIVSKLISHLLTEYTCGLQSLADYLYLFPHLLSLNLNLLKYCTQITGEPVVQIVPNIWVTSNGKEGWLFFYVPKNTIFLGKVLLLCIVNAQHRL